MDVLNILVIHTSVTLSAPKRCRLLRELACCEQSELRIRTKHGVNRTG